MWLLENHPHPAGLLQAFSLLLHDIQDGIAADDFVDGVDQEEEATVLLPDVDRVSWPNLQPVLGGEDAQRRLG